MKKFVTIGDDFGFSLGVNKGFVEAYKSGFLKEMSLMVFYPGTDDAVKLSKENNIDGVGLHITLSNLNRDGVYWRASDYEKILVSESKESLIDKVKIEMDEFYRLMGRLPSHINSHQYTDRHEKLFGFILDFAAKNNIAIRNPKHVITGNSGMKLFDHEFIESTLLKFETNMTEYSLSEISGEFEDTKKMILEKLKTIPDEATVEFAFHPGYVDDVLKKYTSLLQERERDVKLLTDSDLKNQIEAIGFKILNYKELFN